jgi:Protein of unknown function (DUF3592)
MSKKYQVEGFAKKPPRETNRLLSLLALIFGGVGVLILGIDLFFFLYTQQQITNVLHVQGKVVELVAQDTDEDASVAPRISFVAKNGDTYTFTSSVSTYPPSFQKGQTVELYYDPKNPKEAVIDTFWELWFVNVLLTGISLPFLGVGLALAWIGSRFG